MSDLKEYIERDAALWLVYSGKIMTGDNNDHKSAQEHIKEIPSADVRPVVRAHWHDVYQTGPCSWAGTCSHCGQANDIPPPQLAHFCPNCGADMRRRNGKT